MNSHANINEVWIVFGNIQQQYSSRQKEDPIKLCRQCNNCLKYSKTLRKPLHIRIFAKCQRAFKSLEAFCLVVNCKHCIYKILSLL